MMTKITETGRYIFHPTSVHPDCPTGEDSTDEDNVTLHNGPTKQIQPQPAEVSVQGEDHIISDTMKDPIASNRRKTWAYRKQDLETSQWSSEVQGAFECKRSIEWFQNFVERCDFPVGIRW